MTKFLANSYFIFQRLECYTTLIVKELLYNKNQMFYFYFKKCRAYITVTVTNISNSIIKQYYVVIKLLRVLLILKKNSLAELIFLFRTGLSRLINKLSLISRICLSCPYAKMVNSSKDGIILQFTRWSQIALCNYTCKICKICRCSFRNMWSSPTRNSHDLYYFPNKFGTHFDLHQNFLILLNELSAFEKH